MLSRKLEIADADGRLVLHWLEWGDPSASRTVLCVHGLTRNAHDFVPLAERLARNARVLALDVAGRGGSGWLADPERYTIPAYVAQIRTWLGALGIGELDWIGTSMGGLIGMLLAAGEGSPIRRLVLNDVGPLVSAAALAPIRTYLGLELRFADLAALEQHLRLIHAPFGPLPDAAWRHLATHSARQDGAALMMHYDPAIRVPFDRTDAVDVDLWPVWEQIRSPVLLLRGEASTVLDADTALSMTRRGPQAKLVAFPGVGHAPALMEAGQIEAVAGWLGL